MIPTSDERTVTSHVLGDVTANPEQILDFPNGILGFPEAQEFMLVATERAGFYWIQSLLHETLTFLVLDPFIHIPDFSVELPDDEMGTLGTEAGKLVVLSIVTLPAGPDDILTVNLQGPLVINTDNGIGQQLILHDSPHGTRYTLDVDGALLAS